MFGARFAYLVFIGTLAVASQLAQLSQQVAPVPQDGKVRVYVYRNSGVMAREFRPPVYVDEADVVRLQAGRSVILALRPGTHMFRSTDRKEKFQIDLQPGRRYYVRIDVAVVSLKGRGKLNMVLPEQGVVEYGQTKPADKSVLQDRTLIAPEFVSK